MGGREGPSNEQCGDPTICENGGGTASEEHYQEAISRSSEQIAHGTNYSDAVHGNGH